MLIAIVDRRPRSSGRTAAEQASMRQISSKATFFVKRIYPIIFVAAVILFFAFPLMFVERARIPSLWPLLPTMVLVLLVGYWAMKKLLFDLVDAVFEDGNALVVKSDGREERVSVSDIAAAGYTSVFNPMRVTLSLRRPTSFGTEIAFLAPAGVLPFVKSADIRALIKKIEAQRAA
jgi:hypothetical protein